MKAGNRYLYFITPRVKIITLAVALMALLIHFTLVTVHATPFVSDQHKLFYIARSYASTFFHQSWNLFVPAPDNNYQLFVEYENNGLQKKEIFGELMREHQSNRFKGYEPLLISLSNSIYVFEKITARQSTMNGPVQNDINFTMIEHAAKNYIQHTDHIVIKKPKLILLVENVTTKTRHIYFN